MAPQAIIFDLDGTLIDTNEAHIDAWREAFRAYGHDIASDRLRPEIGKGGDHLVEDVVGADEELRIGEALRALHDTRFAHIASEMRFQLFEGTLELLDTLHRRWLTTAIATSSKRSMVEATFKSAGVDLAARVDVLVTADDAERSKPSPDLMFAAMEKLSLAADQCVMIGDTSHDGVAATRADLPFIGLTCGRCASESDLMLANAVSVWRDPRDLLEHLDQTLAMAAAVHQG